MKLHVNSGLWEVKEVSNLKGTDFSTAAIFTELKPGRTFVFPLISENSEIWQVAKDEFVILSGGELVHIKLQTKSGAITLFKTPAKIVQSLLDGIYFYFESFSSKGHIYSVHDHLELEMILKNTIDPDVVVKILNASENRPMLIQIEAPYLLGRFLLEEHSTSLVFYDCDNSNVKDFEDFVALAKERCSEERLAKYYEKCGGYSINGNEAVGIFTEKTYGNSTTYEFSPNEFFNKVAIPKLLLANNLIETMPNKICSFLGKTIDTPEFSIGLSSDVLIITEHKDDGDKFYALEMYGETCLGITQIGEKDFLAINAKNPSTPFVEVRRFMKYGTADKYVWDSLPSSHSEKHSVAPIFCQLTDDIIVYAGEYIDRFNSRDIDMWSISKKKLVNLADSFDDLRWATADSYICHMEKQILVKPMAKKNTKQDPQIMIALRLYRPKEHCDVYALIDPSKKYRIHGKVYNMLADSIISKPRTVRGLVKLFKENESLKQKYSL